MVVIVTQNSKTQIVTNSKTESETKHKNIKCGKILKLKLWHS